MGTAQPSVTTSEPVRPGRRFSINSVLLYTALTGLAILFCLPFVWLVLTSLKPPAEVFSTNWLPSEWRWSNYRDIFEVAPVWRWMWNTVVITTLAVLAVAFSSSLVAYGFARIR